MLDTHMTMLARADAAAPIVPMRAANQASRAVLIDRDTMLVAGSGEMPPPDTADVLFGDTLAHRGAWRSLSWTDGNAVRGPWNFIGVLRTDDIVRLQAMGASLEAPGMTTRFTLPLIEQVELDAKALFAHLRATTLDLAAAMDFLRRVLLAPATAAPSPRVGQFLLEFLQAISAHDGFIDILGRPESGGLLAQGWAVHLRSGPLEVVMADGGLDLEQAAVGVFERPDLLATARGIVVYLPDAKRESLDVLRRIYFRAGNQYFHLDVADDRVLLEGPETAAQVRDMLAKLQMDQTTARAFKRVCRAAFPGHETVSKLEVPVRMACDVTEHADGRGIFVSGWLLDPLYQVKAVFLKSTDGFNARIDESWVRTPRPDVHDGFAKDPLFSGRLRAGDMHHGFLAFVPRADPLNADEAHYFEINLEDETSAFLPIQFETTNPADSLRRVLNTISADEPMIDDVIASHLGPTATALLTIRRRPSANQTPIPFGSQIERPEISIIIPLTTPRPDFDVNLARFGSDPDFQHAELIVVARRGEAEHVSSLLRRCAKFYGLGGTLVISDAPIDYFDALEIGARAASAELLLFLAPSVLPCGHGWLSRLVAALKQATSPGVVSPTLLYEDDSVRFAGSKAPPTDLAATGGRFTGYSRHWLKATELTAVWTGTADCALMQRSVFLASNGFSRELAGPELKTLDFALRLVGQGARCYWAPDITLYAPDETDGDPGESWTRVRRLVDRWAFERRWSTVLAAAAGKTMRLP